MICKDCGRMCLPSEGYIIDEEFYCDHCATRCDDCGEYIVKRSLNTYQTADGNYICEDCYENDYFTCDDCGGIYPTDEMNETNRGEKYVCDRCSENYYECVDCGRLFPYRSIRETVNGDYVCDDCFDNNDWTTCEDCEGAVRYDETVEVNGCCYCNACGEEHEIENDGIYSYHGFSDFEPRKMSSENTDQYFGFELEVSGDKDYAEDFLEVMPSVVLMNDSSIIDDGFEIVTQPMSRRYIYEVFKTELDNGLSFLRKKGFSGHNMGGMHVHISADSLSKGQLGQLTNILYGDDNDINTWLCITQRQRSNMDRWCSMTDQTCDYYSIKNSPYNMPYILEESERHTALNRDTRTYTYEIRIFNSNIRTERVMKNLECVFALIDYSKLNEDEERVECDTYGFIQYVMRNKEKYRYLYDYFIERDIQSHHGIKYTEQELEAA